MKIITAPIEKALRDLRTDLPAVADNLRACADAYLAGRDYRFDFASLRSDASVLDAHAATIERELLAHDLTKAEDAP